MISVTAVMLAWGDEPVLVEAVQAVLASTGAEVDVVLVDNGCTNDAVEILGQVAGVTVVEPGENLGFAAGCNVGARVARGDHLAFVNGDAVVRPDALARLVSALDDSVGLTTASLRLYDEPEVMNSGGNPVHYTGLSWAGGLGDPASEHTVTRDVASATGAATACRADRFAELGGFCEPMFAYCEDTELSLRCWQRGWRVVFVPEAVVLHRYEFSRNPLKFYLLERNRLILLLTLFQVRTLLLLALPLVGLELAMLAVSVKDGWARQKMKGWRWLISHRHEIRDRRRFVQSTRRAPDSDIAALLTGNVTPGLPGLDIPVMLRFASRAYWKLVRRFV
ncbi:MAG: glycosyltransferase family 2 protein [Nocardioides sp.]|nr:glycosyltransferase family 2 protein [Nocardioides sp.]